MCKYGKGLTNKSTKELWAVIDRETGEIMLSRGGSSTMPKLMVYINEGRARCGIKFLPNPENYEIRRIYNA